MHERVDRETLLQNSESHIIFTPKANSPRFPGIEIPEIIHSMMRDARHIEVDFVVKVF